MSSSNMKEGYAHSQVELKLSCENLPDLDYFSKSDPQIILLAKDNRTQKWKPTNQLTEVVMNNLNPKFVKSFIVDYIFEELQQFRYIIFFPSFPSYDRIIY